MNHRDLSADLFSSVYSEARTRSHTMRISAFFSLFMIAFGLTGLSPAQAQDDLVYVAVKPCRIVDTREAGGVITANNFRNFRVSGSSGELAVQGGKTDCLDPKAGTGQKPLAISAYVIAVPSPGSDSGVLTAYPSDQQPPPVGAGSTVNFSAQKIIGNTTNITLCDPAGSCPTDGEFAILARSANQQVVIDVQGYFYPVNMNSEIVSISSDFNSSAPGFSEVLTATCPTGSIMTGGGVSCYSDNTNSVTTNSGVISSSAPSGNSFVGQCFSNALSHSFSKHGPGITVHAVCVTSGKVATQ